MDQAEKLFVTRPPSLFAFVRRRLVNREFMFVCLYVSRVGGLAEA